MHNILYIISLKLFFYTVFVYKEGEGREDCLIRMKERRESKSRGNSMVPLIFHFLLSLQFGRKMGGDAFLLYKITFKPLKSVRKF